MKTSHIADTGEPKNKVCPMRQDDVNKFGEGEAIWMLGNVVDKSMARHWLFQEFKNKIGNNPDVKVVLRDIATRAYLEPIILQPGRYTKSIRLLNNTAVFLRDNPYEAAKHGVRLFFYSGLLLVLFKPERALEMFNYAETGVYIGVAMLLLYLALKASSQYLQYRANRQAKSLNEELFNKWFNNTFPEYKPTNSADEKYTDARMELAPF